MPLNGIKTLVYGVDDVPTCTRYFVDFGLPLVQSDAQEAIFQLADGASVVVRSLQDPRLPASALVGPGVREAVFGVGSTLELDRLVEGLRRDREVRVDADGVAHFLSDCGLPLGLAVFHKTPVVNAPDPVNAPGVVHRLNTHRKWRHRARPKTIQHVVFAVKDFRKSFEFFRDRLAFRMTDYQHTFGIYSRCAGSNNHHNLFLLSKRPPKSS